MIRDGDGVGDGFAMMVGRCPFEFLQALVVATRMIWENMCNENENMSSCVDTITQSSS